jgi:hypothetical protein
MRKFRNETALEKACCRYAKKVCPAGENKKLDTKGPFGRTGWPDREFVFPGSDIWFVEFKMPGEEPTEKQWRVIRKLRKLGAEVHVCDNYEAFAKIIDQHAKKVVPANQKKKIRLLGMDGREIKSRVRHDLASRKNALRASSSLHAGKRRQANR